MIQSMTGFATKAFILITKDGSKSNVTISIKSLNSRYFETTCRLSHALYHLETKYIKLLKERLHRGHIYFTIYMSNPNLFKGSVEPALSTLQAYMQAINQIKQTCNITEPVTLNHLLKLPNIFNVEEQSIDSASAKIIQDAINEMIDQVVNARKKEGEALKKDLEKRVAIMSEQMSKIEQRSAIAIEKQKKLVHQALQEIGGDENTLADARKNALYTMLDKIDIHEETVRFASHLDNLEKQLHTKEVEKGKRLDFILQELAREINTVAAKCSDVEISTHAITVKVEIEKAREQVQNIV